MKPGKSFSKFLALNIRPVEKIAEYTKLLRIGLQNFMKDLTEPNINKMILKNLL